MKLTNLLPILIILTLCVSCKKPEFASADPAPEAVKSDRPITFEMNNLNWLASNSSFIFVGRLSAKNVEKDAKGLIVAKNQFNVENIIAGDSREKVVTLTTLGGTADGETMRVSNMPEFVKDQVYVVFTDLKRTVYNPITGNQHGVFLVVDGAIYTYDGRAIIGVEDGVIRVGEPTLEKSDREKTRERSAPLATDPQTSGAIVSMERAPVEAGKPMRLEEFSKAILTARR